MEKVAARCGCRKVETRWRFVVSCFLISEFGMEGDDMGRDKFCGGPGGESSCFG